MIQLLSDPFDIKPMFAEFSVEIDGLWCTRVVMTLDKFSARNCRRRTSAHYEVRALVFEVRGANSRSRPLNFPLGLLAVFPDTVAIK